MAICKDCFHWESCRAMFEAAGGIIVPDDFKGSAVRCKHFVSTADVAPRAEWISVEERLPEVAGRAYLVWDNVQKTAKKRFFYRLPPSIPLETYPYRREYFGNSADYKRYTHWMPLPEPPTMKGGAE